MSDLQQRITDYLTLGGLFNPELADHEAVRDLIIDCRKRIAELEQKAQAYGEAVLRASKYLDRAEKAEAQCAELRQALLHRPYGTWVECKACHGTWWPDERPRHSFGCLIQGEQIAIDAAIGGSEG